MERFKTAVVFALLFFCIQGTPIEKVPRAPMFAYDGVLVIIDRSMSMLGLLSGVKVAVRSLLESLDAKQPSGLIHFDGCGQQFIQYGPRLGLNNRSKIIKVVNGLEADGLTDLTGALRLAKGVMDDTGLCPQVALFTDNMDTCGGDPAILMENPDDFCGAINVITSSSDTTVLKYFKKISSATRGRTYAAYTAEEIQKAIFDIQKKVNKQKHKRIRMKRREEREEEGTGDFIDDENDGNDKKRKREPARIYLEEEKEKEGGES